MKFRPCRVAGRGRLHYRDIAFRGLSQWSCWTGRFSKFVSVFWLSWELSHDQHSPSLSWMWWSLPPACLCLNNSLPQPEDSQVLPLFFPTVSYCAQWTHFSSEQMQPSWEERHRVMLSLSAGQELLWVCLNARYLHTSLDCSHHWQICLMKNHICTLEGPALVSPFLHWDWVVIWAGTSSWHSQAPSLCFFCSWFWSSDCSKWADFIWPCANKKFFWHLRL